MVGDHEDYLPGQAPAAHGPSHELAGDDEISVAGLAGITNELAAHALIATAHQDAPGLIAAHALITAAHHARYTDVEATIIADAQIAIHAAVVDAHHARYTDVEARASINNIFGSDGKADVDINLDTHKLINVVDPVTDQGGDTKKARNDAIATHAGLATVHQNAPALIETHRLVAAAHHAKYTDGEARAVHSPMTIHPAAFVPYDDRYDFMITDINLHNRVTLTTQYAVAHLIFPNGVTITKLTFYAYRDDAASTMSLILKRTSFVGTQADMATVPANWVDGNNSGYDDSIALALIDNENYSYHLLLVLLPNDNVLDIQYLGAKIEFTG